MPIPPMILGPMLGPFQGMMTEVEGKGLSGEHVDAMRESLARLQALGAQHSDVAAFQGQVTQENLFMRFSEAYGKALGAAAKAEAKAGGSDDSTLLANTLQGYEQALAAHRGTPDEALYAPAITAVLELGRSGVSYPVFLRRLEELGLSDALNAPVATRAGLVADVRFACEAHMPPEVERALAQLDAFDALVQKSRFDSPEPLELELTRRRITHEHAPTLARWKAIERRCSKILRELNDWVDSFCSFAPRDERWCPPGMQDQAKVRENIARDQECLPGILRVRLALLEESFGITFDGIFVHPVMANEHAANRIEHADEKIGVLRQAFPSCVPGGRPPAELIAAAEDLQRRGAHVNPRRAQRVALPIPERAR